MKKIFLKIRNYLNFSTEPPEIISLNRVRNVLRGNRIIRKKGNHTLMQDIYAQITETPIIDSDSRIFDKFILGNRKIIGGLAYRQYLLFKLTGTRLSATVLSSLYSLQEISHPLPNEWIKVLQNNGVKVSCNSSKFLFFIFGIKMFVNAFGSFFKLNMINVLFIFKKERTGKHIYLFDLQESCFPPLDGTFTHNIVHWYLSWEGRREGISQIRHEVKIEDRKYQDIEIVNDSYLPRLDSMFGVICFFYWSFFSLILSFFSLILGYPKYAILLSEMQKAKMFELARKSSIAKEYLFNNANMIYRWIWTYNAEDQGAKITLYNWSAGFTDILGSHGYPPPDRGESIQNWPNILQWSSLYANHIRSVIKDQRTQIKLVPPIFFNDIKPIVINSNKPIITIFDVTPQKPFFHDILTPSVEYRTYENGKQFLEDIYESAQKLGFDILWKRKRDFESNHSKQYIKFCSKFIQQTGVIEVDPKSSAFVLVQKGVATISMPFTSTALVAQSFQKPSIYYDPTMRLFKNDRGAQGIPFVIGKNELDNWMEELKNSID